MKRIKIALSIAALLATVTVVGVSGSQVASADDEIAIAGSKCDCQYQSGAYGVIQNNDCVVLNCWRPIE